MMYSVINMYKFIMVDDETLELKLLSEIVPWNEYGLCLDAAFDNSADAIEYLKRHRDTAAMFTDIKMPQTDGCELAKIAKELNPNIEIVFISAYSDFEYAKMGYKYQVVDYVLKPVSIENIKECCISLKSKLDNSKQTRENATDIETLKRQQYLYEYISDDISKDEFFDRIIKTGINAGLSECYAATAEIIINNYNTYMSTNWQYGADRLYSAIINLLQFANYICIPIIYSFNKMYLMFLSAGASYEDFNQKMQNLQSILNSECDETILANIEAKVLSTSSDIEFEKQNCKKHFSLPDNRPMTQDSSPNTVKRAIEYINENYMHDITLTEIADHVYLTPYHFSKVFKSSTGEKYIDFLNKTRIEKAKRLLSETEMKITDIYHKVGYSSKNHFYKMFKYLCQMTPQEYRNRNYKKG